MSDAELNKAALLIAKLLIRTREGKLQWKSALSPQLLTSADCYSAELGEGLEARLSRDDKELGFQLWGPPAVDLPIWSSLSGAFGGRNSNEVISISLGHSYGKTGLTSPETIVYSDLNELVSLAADPKSVSDDIRYKQAMNLLDKLTA